MSMTETWPELAYDSWSDTLETIHMWCQIVGKIRLAATPWTNHSWHVPLYVTPTGFTTSTMYRGGRQFDIEFDFSQHQVVVRTGEGNSRVLELRPRTVASFYDEIMRHLKDLGLDIVIYDVPNEVEEPIRFPEDTVHRSYDAAAANRFAQAVNQSTRVFTAFRAKFVGKCSPIHFFWGSFDLAVTRFSGRRAPGHPGGVTGLPDWVTREAYSHEVYSCGFWPGGKVSPTPAFYAYAYPTPEGFGQTSVSPPSAFWSGEMGEFFLPYDAVRLSSDPDATLMTFLDSTYAAAADLGNWNRGDLEVAAGFPVQIE